MAAEEYFVEAFQELEKYRSEGFLCDTVLITGNKGLRAHSIILASASPLLRQAIEANADSVMRYVFLPEFDFNTVCTAVNFMYTGCLMLPNEYAEDEERQSKMWSSLESLGLSSERIKTSQIIFTSDEFMVERDTIDFAKFRAPYKPKMLKHQTLNGQPPKSDSYIDNLSNCSDNDMEEEEEADEMIDFPSQSPTKSHVVARDISFALNETMPEEDDGMNYSRSSSPFESDLIDLKIVEAIKERFREDPIVRTNGTMFGGDDAISDGRNVEKSELEGEARNVMDQSEAEQSLYNLELDDHSYCQRSETLGTRSLSVEDMEEVENNVPSDRGVEKDDFAEKPKEKQVVISKLRQLLTENGTNKKPTVLSHKNGIDVDFVEYRAKDISFKKPAVPGRGSEISINEELSMNFGGDSESSQYIASSCSVGTGSPRKRKKKRKAERDQEADERNKIYEEIISSIVGAPDTSELEEYCDDDFLKKFTECVASSSGSAYKKFVENSVKKRRWVGAGCRAEPGGLSVPSVKRYGCTECGKRFSTLGKVMHHSEFHARLKDKHRRNGKRPCPKCGKILAGRQDFRLHMLEHSESEIPNICPHCGKSFRDLRSLRWHEMLHEEKQNFTCERCGRGFREKTKYVDHVNINHSEWVCPICSMTFAKRTELVKHGPVEHCEKIDFTQVRRVLIDTESGTVTQLPEHLCKTCGKGFVSLGSLHVHLAFHKSSLKCDVCNKEFYAQRALMRHKLRHTNYVVPPEERQFWCEECEREYYDANSLHRHMMLVHSGESYPCVRCHKVFVTQHRLNLHMRLSHGEECPNEDGVIIQKDYPCKYCHEVFPSCTALSTHSIVHKDERSFVCKMCNKRLASLSSLSRHILSHSGVKPHICTICDKRFARQKSLKSHMYHHWGVKPFACEACAKTYMNVVDLRRHFALSHDGMNVKLERRNLPSSFQHKMARVVEESCSGLEQCATISDQVVEIE